MVKILYLFYNSDKTAVMGIERQDGKHRVLFTYDLTSENSVKVLSEYLINYDMIKIHLEEDLNKGDK